MLRRRPFSLPLLAAIFALSVGLAAQAKPVAVVQPGAPGTASKTMAKVPAFHDPAFTPADVEFMQGMIHHHAQALTMVAMIPSHSTNRQLRMLGDKIQLAQRDEMKMMKEWLKARGQPVPMDMPDGSMMMGSGTMAPMPGMLTPAQMKALAAAKGPAFDKLFLTGMIQHHTGALNMVADLRAQGGGKEINIADFLIGVDTDQRMEIDRMNGMLGRRAQ